MDAHAQCKGKKPNSLTTAAPPGFLFNNNLRRSLFGLHLFDAKCNGNEFVLLNVFGPAGKD